MLTKMISKNGLVLAIFAAVCVGLIAITYYVTRQTIAGEMEAALARTLNQLVEKSEYNNDVYHDCTLVEDASKLGSSKPLKAYRMRQNGEPVAVAMESVAPNGYSGKIAMVIGIYEDGTIAGVRITDHKETPGLGDKVDAKKSDWVLEFTGKSLNNPKPAGWTVTKDGGQFDAFTGATITPRAVIQQVAQTLTFFETNKQMLFDGPQNCGGSND